MNETLKLILQIIIAPLLLAIVGGIIAFKQATHTKRIEKDAKDGEERIKDRIDERTQLYARVKILEERAQKDDERYDALFEKYSTLRDEVATLRAENALLKSQLDKYGAVQQENVQLKSEVANLKTELIAVNKANKHLHTELTAAHTRIHTLETELSQFRQARVT